jgi:hypothetical protein
MLDINSAVQAIRNPNWEDLDAYQEALEYVGQHTDQLTCRLFFVLPGGLGGNSEERWKRVKEMSIERCGCGNERMFMPAKQRQTFEPGETVIVKNDGVRVPIRPKGGDKASTWGLFWIMPEEDAMAYMLDPYAPLVFNVEMLFSTPGFKLDKLEDALKQKPDDMVLYLAKKDDTEKTPICRIAKVDREQKEVTLILDAGNETFDEKTEPDNPHACTKSESPETPVAAG